MAYGYGFMYMIAAQVVFFIATILFILWIVKSRSTSKNETPLEILNRRLALSEITSKEYDEYKKKITREK